jgi:hypothetical protein
MNAAANVAGVAAGIAGGMAAGAFFGPPGILVGGLITTISTQFGIQNLLDYIYMSDKTIKLSLLDAAADLANEFLLNETESKIIANKTINITAT